LYSDDWDDVPSTLRLSNNEMQWFVSSADSLQTLGKVHAMARAPRGCFQSGQNLYCADSYELASVSHYHVERGAAKHTTEVALRDIAVIYGHSVAGVVEDVKREGSQRLLKLGGQWYHGEKPGVRYSKRPK
jgi:hypothetical protein